MDDEIKIYICDSCKSLQIDAGIFCVVCGGAKLKEVSDDLPFD